MVLDKPIMEVVSEFHFKYCNDDLTPVEYLRDLGVTFKLLTPFEPLPDREGGIKYSYLASVPSLNSTGTLHHVIVVLTDNKISEVLDPNKGRSNVRYYTTDQLEIGNVVDAYLLRSYILEIEFDVN